jgi:phosphopantothenoylcysteine decarboxylase/phosphopantothenate--cysteine ligase
VLNGRNILFGVTGSIAAYKSLEIIRRLTEEGATVTVIMSKSACRFISPLTFEIISGRPVYTDLFEGYVRHINLVKETHLFMIAPATANTINKCACGIADNLLCTAWISYEGPALMAPAMNSRMYRNSIVQENVKSLARRGVIFVGPESGDLACGEEGVGRMSDVSDVVETVKYILAQKDLRGHRILVTAGPTRESFDPVRFISNRSSGRMGFAIAEAAQRRGAEVTLISGPTMLKPPRGVSFIPVERATDMERAVLKNFRKATSAIMAAAVCDFTPSEKSKSKIPKRKDFVLKLRETPDILQKLGKRKEKRLLIGFAAETGNNKKRSQDKLKRKNLDLMVFNDVTRKGAGFNTDTNIVSLMSRDGNIHDLPLMRKQEIAESILDWIAKHKSKPR